VANTLLTPDMIANEILRVLHANLTFLKRVDRQYDSSFGIRGAQIGSTLRIKKPPRYTVTTGASMGSFQNSTETVVPLTISTQKNIGIQFSSEELTLHINDFSQQFIQPAMKQLASTVEADVISQMIKQVPNQVGSWLSPLNAMRPVLRAGQIMTDSLALLQDRTLMINTASRVELIDSLKGLSESSGAIASQYREGTVAHVGGFDFIESTLLPVQTPANWGGTPLVGSVSGLEGTSSIATTGWTASTAAVNVGDILTFANVYAVHPETKVNLGYLKQFAVTAAATADGTGAATISVSPAFISAANSAMGAGFQNVSALPITGAALTIAGAANTAYGLNLAYTKESFTFATADLVDVSNDGAWCGRANIDGISVRIARQWVIGTDQRPARIDILYGCAALYPELACRVANLVGQP
jgi:hypothetical protein